MASDIANEALTLRQKRDQQLNRDAYRTPVIMAGAGDGGYTDFDGSGWNQRRRSHCFYYHEDLQQCYALAYRKHKPINLYCSMERKDLEECKTGMIRVISLHVQFTYGVF